MSEDQSSISADLIPDQENSADDAPKVSRRDLLRDAQRDFAELAEAASPLLRALRPQGICLLCQAKVGEPHRAICPATPFILARGEIVYGNSPVSLLDPPF